MFAYEIPGLRFSLPAGEAIARRRFVNVDANSEGVIATAAGSAIGVSMNQTADGEVLEISDGIVMVEAAAAITAGADVQVGTLGRAITKTTGIGVGVALTSAAAAGQFVAVKLLSVSNANGLRTQTILYTSTDLAAGADLADVAFGAVTAAASIISVDIISLGIAAGIDATNTSVFVVKVGSTTIASKTFTDEVVFPASGAKASMTIAEDTVSAGDVLSLSVTNGATANLPLFLVQLVAVLED